MSSQYVGIMINTPLYKRIPSGKTFHESLRSYELGRDKYRIIPCFFRLQDIQPGQKNIRAFVRDANGYSLKLIPAPKVIHNRAIHFDKRSFLHIDTLIKEGKMIFNRRTRYAKLYIHRLLAQHKALKPHLPETVPASLLSLRIMMQKYNSLLIKPNSSSLGLGIMKLERVKDGWQLIFQIGKHRGLRRWSKLQFAKAIPDFLKRKIALGTYLIQQRLALATYQGKPFDFRISVQRGESGAWQVTGIVGKVAGKGKFLTNVAQGGNVMRLQALLKEYPILNANQVEKNLKKFSLNIAELLSANIPDLGDIGLDVGITKEGSPLFIECNARDLRYSFREGKMLDEWRATYLNPMGYARYLLNKRMSGIRTLVVESSQVDKQAEKFAARDETTAVNGDETATDSSEGNITSLNESGGEA